MTLRYFATSVPRLVLAVAALLFWGVEYGRAQSINRQPIVKPSVSLGRQSTVDQKVPISRPPILNPNVPISRQPLLQQTAKTNMTDAAGRVHVRHLRPSNTDRKAAAQQRVSALRKAAQQRRIGEVRR